MISQLQRNQNSRLGMILLKGDYISQIQLDEALKYQAKRRIKLGTALLELKLVSRRQLNFALKRQSWTRAIAASIALACAPFSQAAFASNSHKAEISHKTAVNVQPIQSNPSSHKFTSDMYLSSVSLDQQSKNFFFSGSSDPQFAFKTNISKSSGLQVKLFTAYSSANSTDITYEFEPQISLFKFSSQSKRSRSYSRGEDHYSNTSPAVYMLTLQGKCLYENAGRETKVWSFDSASQGVQRKAKLMFSVTKQF